MPCQSNMYKATVMAAVLLPLAYYIALSVVIGLDKLWIPFGLSIAVTFTGLLYLVSTTLFVILEDNIRSRILSRQRDALRVYTSRHAAADAARCGAAQQPPAAEHDHLDESLSSITCTEDQHPRQEEVEDADHTLSSIDMSRSSLPQHRAGTQLSATPNPLVPLNAATSNTINKYHVAPRAHPGGNRLMDVAVKPEDDGPAFGSASVSSSTEAQAGAGGVAGGFGGRAVARNNVGAAAHPPARDAWHSVTSLLSDGNDDAGNGAAASAAAARAPHSSRGSGAAVAPMSTQSPRPDERALHRNRRATVVSALISIEAEELDGGLGRFTFGPLLSARIVFTVLHTLTLWAASFVIAYYTNVLMTVLPVFCCPVLWQSLSSIATVLDGARARKAKRALRETGDASDLAMLPLTPRAGASPSSCSCLRVARALTHWAVLAAVCIISLLLYVAAMTLPLVREDELRYEEHKNFMEHLSGTATGPRRVSKAVLAVSYLIPIPMAIFLFVAILGEFVLRRGAGGPTHNHLVCGGATTEGTRAKSRSPKKSAPTPFGHSSDSQEGVEEDDVTHISAQWRDLRESLAAFPNRGVTDSCSSTDSALSSIIRSSATLVQSHWIQSLNQSFATQKSDQSWMSSMRPVRQQSASAVGSQNLHVAPQLKTVTMLHISFRDIFGSDDEDGAADGALQGGGKGRAGGLATAAAGAGPSGHTAARNRQQIMAAKFDALMQAVEDARGTGGGGAAYGLSAGKDRRSRAAKPIARRGKPIDEALRADSDAYVLTAFNDAVVLVWGLLPFSSDPVTLAVCKAQQIFACFRKNPKPYIFYQNGRGGRKSDLSAAVVYAPHSLVGMVGNAGADATSPNFRSVHFFNPDQHAIGAALLERGFQLHREFHEQFGLSAGATDAGRPGGQQKGSRVTDSSLSAVSFSTRDFVAGAGSAYYQGILLDSRAVHAAASHVLARPCGVVAEETVAHHAGRSFFPSRLPAHAAGTVATAPGADAAKKKKFTVMYDFVSFINEKEEEWHLVVQRNEKLSYHFRFLVDATQNLQQNNVGGAVSTLVTGIQEDRRKNADAEQEDESIIVAKMFLEDINYIEAQRTKATEERAAAAAAAANGEDALDAEL